MKITAGKRGDAAREAKDKAENRYYWSNFKRAQLRPTIEKEQNSRVDAATSDIRRQIDRLISDGYAKQIFEDDIYVYIDIGDGNRTFSARNKYLDSVEGPSPSRWSFNDKNPEQIKVRVGTMSKRDAPFTWEWRASFTYDFGKSNEVKYVLKNDVSSYNFKSSAPADIEYFAACGEILKALSKVNWGKILTTDPYEGMEELYKQYPSKPDASVLIPEGATNQYGEKLYSKYNNNIKEADIQDALEEWKQGEKWLYVGTPRGSYSYRYRDTETDPYYDSTTSLMQENGFYKGWYKYIGETDKYYKVIYMPYSGDAASKMKEGLPPEPTTDQWKDKVRKDEFEHSIYYPITWYGRA